MSSYNEPSNVLRFQSRRLMIASAAAVGKRLLANGELDAAIKIIGPAYAGPGEKTF
jgi:hypothetical protein